MWTELGRLVREERRRGSEVAMAIDDVCFEKNQVTLRDIYICVCVCMCVCVCVCVCGRSWYIYVCVGDPCPCGPP